MKGSIASLIIDQHKGEGSKRAAEAKQIAAVLMLVTASEEVNTAESAVNAEDPTHTRLATQLSHSV